VKLVWVGGELIDLKGKLVWVGGELIHQSAISEKSSEAKNYFSEGEFERNPSPAA
jgi:hypothetical protein